MTTQSFQDTFELVITPEKIQGLVKQLAETIKIEHGSSDIVLIAFLKGAVYFLTDFSRALEDIGVSHSLEFVSVSSYEGETKKELKVNLFPNINKLKNKHIVLLDELWDTGNTMTTIRNQFLELGIDRDKITTLTMFKKDLVSTISPDMYGCVIPNRWVVGYGMDNGEGRRGLRGVWAKK